MAEGTEPRSRPGRPRQPPQDLKRREEQLLLAQARGTAAQSRVTGGTRQRRGIQKGGPGSGAALSVAPR
eukprot:SM013886S00208  [mRNA]  locus=s13886:43:322:+ [translate_table: standard]